MTDPVILAAIEEAYASAPVGVVVIDTIEMSHPALAAPIRVAAGVEAPFLAPLVDGGDEVTFEPCAFSFTPPARTETGIEPATAAIDGVGGLMAEIMDQLIESDAPLDVVYRQYRSDLAVPIEEWSGFVIRRLETDGVTTSAQIELPDVSAIVFPRQTYSLALYPGLHAGAT